MNVLCFCLLPTISYSIQYNSTTTSAWSLPVVVKQNFGKDGLVSGYFPSDKESVILWQNELFVVRYT